MKAIQRGWRHGLPWNMSTKFGQTVRKGHLYPLFASMMAWAQRLTKIEMDVGKEGVWKDLLWPSEGEDKVTHQPNR
jgi:hypothetical protein